MQIRPEGRVIALPRERSPFQVCVLAVGLLYAIVTTIWYGSLAATSVKMFPAPGGRIFLVLLGLGCGSTLVGLWQRGIQGLQVERAGLWLLVCLCLSYTLWTPFAVGVRGIGLMLWMGILLALPSAIVAVRLGRQIKDAEEAVARARPSEGDDGADVR